jgi:signal transduction histidine kinase
MHCIRSRRSGPSLARIHRVRARIAEAALNERRSIERNLHDGLQHRLLRLSWLAERAKDAVGTGPARSFVTELGTEARHAYTALRELAQGIHPAILSEQGLACAVEELAMRSHVPMDVALPGGRWPAPVEATAFFVIQEAATNAAKHANASRIAVRGVHRSGRLVVEIADDGVGGADPQRGTGLRRLHDRVTAIGGTLVVRSAFQQGTSVTLDLPCA